MRLAFYNFCVILDAEYFVKMMQHCIRKENYDLGRILFFLKNLITGTDVTTCNASSCKFI